MAKSTMIAALSVMTLGVVLYVLHLRHFARKEEGGGLVRVAVLAMPLEMGDAISPAHLVFREVPIDHTEERHVLASQVDRVFGVPARVDLKSGEWLNWNDVSSIDTAKRGLAGKLGIGYRAYTVTTSNEQAGRVLAVGDRVDVLVTAQRPNSEMMLTTLLVQNVEIVAVGERQAVARNRRRESEESGNSQSRYVTLSVTPSESTVLQHALYFAERMTLIVRNEHDRSIRTENIPVVTEVDLIEAEHRQRVQFTRAPESITRIQ